MKNSGPKRSQEEADATRMAPGAELRSAAHRQAYHRWIEYCNSKGTPPRRIDMNPDYTFDEALVLISTDFETVKSAISRSDIQHSLISELIQRLADTCTFHKVQMHLGVARLYQEMRAFQLQTRSPGSELTGDDKRDIALLKDPNLYVSAKSVGLVKVKAELQSVQAQFSQMLKVTNPDEAWMTEVKELLTRHVELVNTRNNLLKS